MEVIQIPYVQFQEWKSKVKRILNSTSEDPRFRGITRKMWLQMKNAEADYLNNRNVRSAMKTAASTKSSANLFREIAAEIEGED